ncbi:MAG: class I SAM-dependent methyltransferase [Spirochaetaceae bacterium]|nr:MAG: class I SAM-dependent methyltransferase [Spirochaetaceae bacterium]
MINCLCCGASPQQSTPVITTAAHMHHRTDGPGGDNRYTFVRCSHCGLTYLNPPVPPQELGRFYPDYYLPYRGPSAWGRYAPLAARGQALTDRKRVRRVGGLLGKGVSPGTGPLTTANPRILDVGCGHPTFLRRLVDRYPEVDATGIDFVDSGWREKPDAWQGITLVQSDPVDFTSRQPFDLITMWHYLEHDYHPIETLRRLRTMAHKNTRLLVEVPDLESLSRRWYGPFWEGWHAPRHTVIYSGSTLRETLRRSGWEVVNRTTRGTLDTFALWWMSSMERRGIDWTASMESRFLPFMAGRVLTAPLFALEGILPLGVQLVEARPQSG